MQRKTERIFFHTYIHRFCMGEIIYFLKNHENGKISKIKLSGAILRPEVKRAKLEKALCVDLFVTWKMPHIFTCKWLGFLQRPECCEMASKVTPCKKLKQSRGQLPEPATDLKANTWSFWWFLACTRAVSNKLSLHTQHEVSISFACTRQPRLEPRL